MRQVSDNIIPLQTAATITTTAIPSLNLFYCSAQVSGAGGAGGTLQLQASNDETNGINTVPVNWSNIPSASVTVTGDGSFLIPKTDLCYQWVRLVYTNTGTGTISVVFKALGA
jgi:hypothetical protein